VNRETDMSVLRFAGRRPLRALAAATLLAGALAVPAFADTATITSGVTAGALGETLGAYTQPASFALDGTDHTQTFSIPVDVNDASGSGAGWKLQMSAAVFTDAASDTLPTTALSIGSAVTITPGTGTAPIDTISTGTGVTTVAAEYFGAQAGTGLGQSTITAPMSLFVPANTKVGSYASTVTIAINSAP
jgi:hypothetical protein